MLAPATLEQKKDAAFFSALHDLKGRLASRNAPLPENTRVVHPAHTVRCPICGNWARPEGNRFYHLEQISLETGACNELRSLFCEIPAPAPVNTGAEVPGGDDSHDPLDDDRPNDLELNEHYLEVNGWTVTARGEADTVWLDPLSGAFYFFGSALEIQQGRDLANGSSFTD